MNFAWTADQRALLDAVERIGESRAAMDASRPVRMVYDAGLQQQLREAGLLEAASIEELGAVGAIGAIMQLARLSVCVELVAASFLAPHVAAGAAGVIALVDARLDAPIRFLPQATHLVRLDGHSAQAAVLTGAGVQPVDSTFGYPMGLLRDPAALRWDSMDAVDPARLHALWRLGVAAEITGSLSAALDAVLEHVKQRRQFGRPLGAFQAVQHRLAQGATSIECARWLCLHAASDPSPLHVAAALAHAQAMSTTLCYDLHQFMGAMGLTLEHPLHRWTYRAKLLRSAFGGAAAQQAQAARAAWPMRETAGALA